ncbi:uncharacterized protein LOC135848714 [Planococcus citri]|uniref:uncharacterized protein LOC135848714 n=1 Tax=Planococcus citri TaxID=170843 RepID=UPI0031F77A1A
MEVEQHLELKMAEVTSEVYDIIHPSPASLKQLSTIAISLELWRLEYRKSRKLGKFEPFYKLEDTGLKKRLPYLPSMIYQMIEKVLSRFLESMLSWIKDHDIKVFCWERSNDFDDYVLDYDGSIDYARTAERMLRWEGFSSEMKFTVACLYFFEEDVRRIWPSVSANMNVDLIDFDKCPAVYYWVCRLTNKLDKIPTCESETVDERMFRLCMPYNGPSIEYFWNRIPLEDRMQHAFDCLDSYDFVRFILPKANALEIDEIVSDRWNGDELYYMFLNLHCDESSVLRTWFHIRNIITESSFTNLIMCMFQDEEEVEWEYLTCQIWKHTPLNLKQSVIKVISSDSSWIAAIKIHDCGDYDCKKFNVDLLLTILQDASLKERNLFLRNCWSCLKKPLRSKDLQRVMGLCCKNQDEINQFKRNFMADKMTQTSPTNSDESEEDESD